MKLLKSLNKFIEQASKNKLWTFGWVVFVACLSFSVRFYMDTPNRIATINATTNRANTYAQDEANVSRVKQIIQDSYGYFIPIADELNIIGGKVAQHESVTEAEINPALSRARTVRQSLAEAAGTLSAISFNDPTLNEHLKTFSDNLNKLRETNDVIIDFYSAVLANDQSKIDEELAAIRQFDLDLQQFGPEMVQTIRTFDQDHSNYQDRMITDLSKETQSLKIYHWETIAAKAAVGYAIIFAIVGIYTWLQRTYKRNKPSRRRSQRN